MKNIDRTSKQFCVHGHDTFECGRYKDGHCIQCDKDYKKRTHVPKKRKKKQFCLRGHDTFVCGRTENNNCNDCLKDHQTNYMNKIKLEQFCPKGHDTFIVGKNKDGSCKKCIFIKNANSKMNRKNCILKRVYGITLEEFNKRLQEQNESCFGCLRHQSEFPKGLVVDHDHKTGKVRGLLCNDCNLILGHAKDTSDILKRLLHYLERDLISI